MRALAETGNLPDALADQGWDGAKSSACIQFAGILSGSGTVWTMTRCDWLHCRERAELTSLQRAVFRQPVRSNAKMRSFLMPRLQVRVNASF